MPLYMTPFRQSDMQCTGPSVDTGLRCLEAARGMFGEPDVWSGKVLIYRRGEESLVVSFARFSIDGTANKP